MGFFEKLGRCLNSFLRCFCPCIHKAIFSDYYDRRDLKKFLGFVGGFILGQLYYIYLLKKIPFPFHLGVVLSLFISIILGIGNAVSIQIRCISLLIFPMYCGKAGRGVLKAVVLTYVVAGPITNMGLNAKEVVRVFACSTELSYNLSKAKYALMAEPFRKAIFGLKNEIGNVKDTIRSIRDVAAPIESEMDNIEELSYSRDENDYIDNIFGDTRRSGDIEKKYAPKVNDGEEDIHLKKYLRKIEYRCNDQLSRAVAICMEGFASAYEKCYMAMPWYAAWVLCWPMKLNFVCNVRGVIGRANICDSTKQIDPGLGEAYVYLLKSKRELTKNLKDIKLQYKVTNDHELHDIQDATETGRRVMHSLEEKIIIMRVVIVVVNIFIAILFLRIVNAALTYHDLYLTSIGYDNLYITDYFKRINKRRKRKKRYTLLPLKKMERSKYIDVHSIKYMASERHKLVTHILKLMLEVITATTFVMLDRLFYEALDVVRQHAEMEYTQEGTHDLEVEVKGTGMIASMVRKVLNGLNTRSHVQHAISNEQCLPRPRLMPTVFFVKIYGGYLWILFLLYVNPYTLRLRRLICSYFYPRREKQRLLHLYNDILKKRMKMQKTLRKKAVQAVRAHYLSGENLLSLRIKFPQLLGWLKIFPAARMKCLICGETEPRNAYYESEWNTCSNLKCPFVYCPECWHEVGERCLACDPSLAELSDIDSLSEEEQPRY